MNCSDTCQQIGSILVPIWRSEIRCKNTHNMTNAKDVIAMILNPNCNWNHIQITGSFPHEAIFFTPTDNLVIIYDSYINVRNKEARVYNIQQFGILIHGLYSSDVSEQRSAYNMLFNTKITDNVNISNFSIFPLK